MAENNASSFCLEQDASRFAKKAVESVFERQHIDADFGQ